MTGDVAVAAPQDELTQIVGAMEKRRVKRLPIVENGKLVGIVSRADLVRALVHSLTAQAAPSARREASDDEIRAAIAAIIDEESWGPRFSIEVAVHAGIVDLRGTITDERARTALVVAAENVPGVKDVHDHLVWVEPTSGLVVGAEAGMR